MDFIDFQTINFSIEDAYQIYNSLPTDDLRSNAKQFKRLRCMSVKEIMRAIELTEREQFIFLGLLENETLEQIGFELSLTRGRISQLIKEIRKKCCNKYKIKFNKENY